MSGRDVERIARRAEIHTDTTALGTASIRTAIDSPYAYGSATGDSNRVAPAPPGPTGAGSPAPKGVVVDDRDPSGAHVDTSLAPHDSGFVFVCQISRANQSGMGRLCDSGHFRSSFGISP